MKRIMALILTFVMLLGALPMYAFAQTEEMGSQETTVVQIEEVASLETAAAEEVFAEETVAEAAEETVAEEALEETVSEEDMAAWQSVVNAYTVAPQSEFGEDLVQESPENATFMEAKTSAALQMNSTKFTEREPNNYMSTADRIYNDYMVSGTISYSDPLDYFKFVLSSKSKVNLLSLSTKSTFMIGILDSSGDAVAVGTYQGKSDGYYCNALSVTLSAGTYYVVPLDENRNSNVYVFSIWWDAVSTPHTHSYTSTVTAPTCTEDGYTTYTCSCGYSYKGSYVDAAGHTYDPVVTAPTCTEDGYTTYTCSCGYSYKGSYVDATGHTYDDSYDPVCNLCGNVRETQVPANRDPVDMFRMYNPNSGEHFYTGSTVERADLVKAGWKYEGVGFTFPKATGRPVYRLYDKYDTYEHLYTMDEAEKDTLINEGWVLEGVAFNSAYESEVPQYRLHNPNATIGAYHFTASQIEKNTLIEAGWEYQGIGFYTLGNKNVA